MQTMAFTGDMTPQITQILQNAYESIKKISPAFKMEHIDYEVLQDIKDAKLGEQLYAEYIANGSKGTSWADIKKENGL